MPTYKIEKICTCDEIGDGPCEAHARENALQDELIKIKQRLTDAEEVLSFLRLIRGSNLLGSNLLVSFTAKRSALQALEDYDKKWNLK